MPGVIAETPAVPYLHKRVPVHGANWLVKIRTDLNVAVGLQLESLPGNCAEYRSFRFELLLAWFQTQADGRIEGGCIIRAVIPYYLRSHSLQLREVFFCQCEQSTAGLSGYSVLMNQKEKLYLFANSANVGS